MSTIQSSRVLALIIDERSCNNRAGERRPAVCMVSVEDGGVDETVVRAEALPVSTSNCFPRSLPLLETDCRARWRCWKVTGAADDSTAKADPTATGGMSTACVLGDRV